MLMYVLFPVSLLTTVISYPFHYNFPHNFHHNHEFHNGQDYMSLPPGPWYPVNHPLHNHPVGHPWHRPSHYFPPGHAEQEWHTFHKEESPVVDISIESSEENINNNPFKPIDNNPIKESEIHSSKDIIKEVETSTPKLTNEITKEIEISTSESIFDITTLKSEIETSSPKPVFESTSKSVEVNNVGVGQETFQPVTESESQITLIKNDNVDLGNPEMPKLFLSEERNDNLPYFISKLIDQTNLDKYLNLNTGKNDENHQMFTSQPSQNSYIIFDQTKPNELIYNLPDILIKNDVIEIKAPNSPKIHIKSPAIVINDDDKTNEGNILAHQSNQDLSKKLFNFDFEENNRKIFNFKENTFKPNVDELTPVFGGTNLDEQKKPTDFHESAYKDLLNIGINAGVTESIDKSSLEEIFGRPDEISHDAPILKKDGKQTDIVSEINEGKFSNVFAPFSPDELKNMAGYNEKELALIEKEISESIKGGFIDFYKGQLETSTESGPLKSDLRTGKIH